MRSDLSPAWFKSTISTIKYVDKRVLKDITTMDEATTSGATVCLKNGTFYAGVVKEKFPKVNYIMCDDEEKCADKLKAEECALYASDELQLRHQASNDATLTVTREAFNTQYIVWAMKDNTPNVRWLKKWLYQAITNTTMDMLFFKYFQKELCPIGTAGESCQLPCDPQNGAADETGRCLCRSSKWTGDDCSIEVEEDLNLIPSALRVMAYVMVGLLLILLGCLISSITIVAMAQEDEGSGPVYACMAIPWLYSVGFSITFGTLFAKIRRVYIIFKSAADMRRQKVTFGETLAVTAAVLFLDVLILSLWTVMDPLHWERTVVAADQFDEPLESEGHCTCDHWQAWIGTISVLHLILLGFACYLCYQARDIPTQFSEGKYVAIAMFSNLQIFVVGVPILIILGSNPEASFFVRTVIIWMNDFVVVSIIFGNLIYHVHFYQNGPGKNETARVSSAIGSAIQQFSAAQKERSHRFASSRMSESISRDDLSDMAMLENGKVGDKAAAMSADPGSSLFRLPTLPERPTPKITKISFAGLHHSHAKNADRGNTSISEGDPIRIDSDYSGCDSLHEEPSRSPKDGGAMSSRKTHSTQSVIFRT